jgi:acyl-CoA synthetase (NDP forming)
MNQAQDESASGRVAHASLWPFFEPRSVAIFGASADAAKIGGRPLRFLQRSSFSGGVYPIKPGAASVQGFPAFDSLDALPAPPDAAIIALPGAHVDAAVAACVERGVKAVTIFSSGFREAGEDGACRERRVIEIARASGTRLLGPNSLGSFSARSGYIGTFATALDYCWPEAGAVAIATQSGAFGSYCYALVQARGLGVSGFIATGNEADVDVAEAIVHFSADPQSKVILAFLEGASDGARLASALRLARNAGKPVVVLKTGSSSAGRAAAASHTGSLAGADAIYDAVIADCGAYRARTIEEAIDLAYGFSGAVRPPTRRIGIVTTSGGVGVLLADEAERHGLEVAPLPEEALAAIQRRAPLASGVNPVDSSAQVLTNMPLLGALVDTVVECGDYGTILLFLAHIGRNPAHFGAVRSALIEARRRHPERLFVLCTLGDDALKRDMFENGFLVFDEPSRAVRTIGAMAHWASRLLPAPFEPQPATSAVVISAAMSELAAARVFADAGIPMALGVAASSPAEAAATALRLGFPVVLKVLSPDIAHKSDAGGVVLGVASEAGVHEAYATIMRSVHARHPQASIGGVLVAPLVQADYEAILGMVRDPVFGPVVMFGLGGVFAELLQDVAFKVAPFSPREARALIESTRAGEVLNGFRGKAAIDKDRLAEVISRFSAFAAANESVLSAEINPLMLSGDAVIGADALIIGAPTDASGVER